jgi:deoxyguanosine kinase
MANYPCIAFEGPIAVGKTTHARLLAERLGIKPMLEDFPGNEFLEDFYGDNARWALPMQLSFLTMRHSQLRTMITPLTQPLVIDYSQLKNSTFARVLLEGRELRLYDQLSMPFEADVLGPDLIVYLDARDEVLLDRIRTRNRAYEAVIDSAYQQRIRNAYEEAFSARPELKVSRYDTSDLDLGSLADIRRLQDTLLSALPHFKFVTISD